MERSQEPQSFFARTKFWFEYTLSEHYGNYEGRASRREYWHFVLANFLLSWAVVLIPNLISETLGMVMSLLYSLAMLPVSFCIAVRRLHDTNRSGWWHLLILVPLVGPFVLLFFVIQPGTPGANAYGEHPDEWKRAGSPSGYRQASFTSGNQQQNPTRSDDSRPHLR